jgi:hypothetical protein
MFQGEKERKNIENQENGDNIAKSHRESKNQHREKWESLHLQPWLIIKNS